MLPSVETKTEKEAKILTLDLKESAKSEKTLAELLNEEWRIIATTNLGDERLALILERNAPAKKNERIGFIPPR